MKNAKLSVVALTACTIALAFIKPDFTPVAAAAVSTAITQLASSKQEKDS
ncbi:MAG: hypothetical protein H0X31_00185 [Nostocaceae cyanobacterium]|nr:hypothetical protein [Nostocaceae cyanobacterium]